MASVFRLYSRELLPLYVFVCILFVMGVVFGAILVNELTLEQKRDVGQYLNTFLTEYTAAQSAEGTGAASAETNAAKMWDTFGSHARWVFFIWILGLSVVGVPLILLLDFLKGVLVGFTVGYLAGQWSWNGVMFAFASVLPQNMIAVPVIIVTSVAAISFSILLVRNRFINKSGVFARPFAAFTIQALLLTSIMLAVSLFEVYVSPELMKWAAPMLAKEFV